MEEGNILSLVLPKDIILKKIHDGFYEDAIEKCNEILASQPKNISILTLRGYSKQQLGNRDHSLQYYEQALADYNTILESVQQTVSKANLTTEVNRKRLHAEAKIKTKLAPYLPDYLELGAAVSEGDCFFDAIAQGINQLGLSKKLETAKSLRLLCDAYAKDPQHTWVKEALLKDKDNYEQYLTRIQFTADEMEAMEAQGLKLGPAVWGRPFIEGRMICEIFNLKLHIMEIPEETKETIAQVSIMEQLVDDARSCSIEQLQKTAYADPRMLHLAVSHLHFVPLLNNTLPNTAVLTMTQSNEHSSLNETQLDALLARAQIYNRALQQPHKAILDLETILAIQPKNVRAITERGEANFELQQYEAAIKNWDEALDIQSTNNSKKDFDTLLQTKILTRKAEAKYRLNHFTQALEACEQALLIDPNCSIAIEIKKKTKFQLKHQASNLTTFGIPLQNAKKEVNLDSNKTKNIELVDFAVEASYSTKFHFYEDQLLSGQTAIHIWYSKKRRGGAGVGHIALAFNDGEHEEQYISFWPAETPRCCHSGCGFDISCCCDICMSVTGTWHTKFADYRAEAIAPSEGRLPDYTVKLNSLDTKQMYKQFKQLREIVQNWSALASTPLKKDLKTFNCISVASILLIAGGIEQLAGEVLVKKNKDEEDNVLAPLAYDRRYKIDKFVTGCCFCVSCCGYTVGTIIGTSLAFGFFTLVLMWRNPTLFLKIFEKIPPNARLPLMICWITAGLLFCCCACFKSCCGDFVSDRFEDVIELAANCMLNCSICISQSAATGFIEFVGLPYETIRGLLHHTVIPDGRIKILIEKAKKNELAKQKIASGNGKMESVTPGTIEPVIVGGKSEISIEILEESPSNYSP